MFLHNQNLNKCSPAYVLYNQTHASTFGPLDILSQLTEFCPLPKRGNCCLNNPWSLLARWRRFSVITQVYSFDTQRADDYFLYTIHDEYIIITCSNSSLFCWLFVSSRFYVDFYLCNDAVLTFYTPVNVLTLPTPELGVHQYIMSLKQNQFRDFCPFKP